jgi:hypothetical protein
MGKLIKNHWARLIILTSASCKFNLTPTQSDAPRPTSDNKNRPTSRRPRSLLLAQILLRLPDQKLRRRRQTRPHPASPQRRHRARLPRLRMAAEMGRGLEPTPQHGGTAAVVAAGDFERCAAVPNDECGAVLCYWVRGVFLGV